MNTPLAPKPTHAYFVQSVLAFAVSSVGLLIGIIALPVGEWPRAFLAIGLLFTISSAFTLAKCVRDRQEISAVVERVDQARLDKLLAEHDPFTPAAR
jgi:hypothetical protein